MEYNEEAQISSFVDIWSILYIHLTKKLISRYGIEGEKIVRTGIYNFGVERGKELRDKHIRLGLKLNLYNLFTYGDRPDDPRFKRNKIKLSSQERFVEVIKCPIAEKWEEMGYSNLGRIYCEEFHHAKFMTYAPKAQVNLTQTLTQDGDNCCRFSVYLRPGNMNRDELKNSFEEFDPDYSNSNVKQYTWDTHKEGYEKFCIKLYYFIVFGIIKKFGNKGEELVDEFTKDFINEVLLYLENKANLLNLKFGKNFIENFCPFSLNEESKVWAKLNDCKIKDIFYKSIAKSTII